MWNSWAVIVPVTVNEPVIAESPLLCPVVKNVWDADIKFCPCQEPEISVAIWAELLKKVYELSNEPVAEFMAPEMSDSIWYELLKAPLKIPIKLLAVIVPLALKLPEAVMLEAEPDNKPPTPLPAMLSDVAYVNSPVVSLKNTTFAWEEETNPPNILPLALILPLTVNFSAGVFVPIPTLSADASRKNKFWSFSPYMRKLTSFWTVLKLISLPVSASKFIPLILKSKYISPFCLLLIALLWSFKPFVETEIAFTWLALIFPLALISPVVK